MALPKPPRKNSTMKFTNLYDTRQPAYEDLDASMPAVTDGSQSEVKVKPLPLPKPKLQPKAQCNTNNNTADSVDTNSNTTNERSSQLNQFPADFKRTLPVRPPPRPPTSKCTTLTKPPAAVDGGCRCISSNVEPTVKPPAISTEGTQAPPPPRPPLSPIYYGKPPSMSLKSEICTDEGPKSRCSSISPSRPSLHTSASSGEVGSLRGTYSSAVNCTVIPAPDSTGRPAVPPRLGRSSLPCSTSKHAAVTLQTRPPPPTFSPPPPPSTGTPNEPLYSEIPSYIYVLPDKETKTNGGSTLCTGGQHHEQTTGGTQDICAMLKWLEKVSYSACMPPSLYGLSIEEEIRSFSERAMNVQKALRLYNLLMMKRHESLRELITEFSSICGSLDKVQKTTKTMGIAGGTTGAVGGVTAVLGIALAPMTMGASLIATAVGAGMVVSAGGMGAHAAKANKKTVNRMKVETLVSDYKAKVVNLEQCLDFILTEMNELRRHDIARLDRAGARHDAVTMAHLSQAVIKSNMNSDRRASFVRRGGKSSEKALEDFTKELDQYFTEKNGQKLKKSNKSRFSDRVRQLAENLKEELDHLCHMWETFSLS